MSAGHFVVVAANTPHFQDGSRQLVDLARTSDNGAFAGLGDFGNAVDVLARVTRKNIGRSGHRHICGRASTSSN